MPWSRKSGDQEWHLDGSVAGAGIHDYEPSITEWPRFMMRIILSIILRTWNLRPGRLDPNLQGSKLRWSKAARNDPWLRWLDWRGCRSWSGKEAKHLYDPAYLVRSVKIREEGKIIAQRLGEIDPKNRSAIRPMLKKAWKALWGTGSHYQPLWQR